MSTVTPSEVAYSRLSTSKVSKLRAMALGQVRLEHMTSGSADSVGPTAVIMVHNFMTGCDWDLSDLHVYVASFFMFACA